VLENSHRAALRLAQEGPIKDRLAEAYDQFLAGIGAAEVPESYRTQFAEMCRAMCSVCPLPRENPVHASVRKMSAAEASQYAGLIVGLFGEMAREARPVGTLPLTAQPTLAPFRQRHAAEG
jgi:hypothetical protein